VVDGTTFAGPQVYPGPAPSSVKFLCSFTVLLVVPARPTLTWKAETEAEGSWPYAPITPPLAAIRDLLVVWDAGEEVDDRGVPPAAVRDVAFEFGAVPLVSGLSSHHGPDHLLLRPRPAQAPPRAHDVPVHLEVVHRHHCLRIDQLVRIICLFVHGVTISQCTRLDLYVHREKGETLEEYN